jgi:hypothetical protein
MQYWRGALIRVALALAGAGVFYVGWLVAFLLLGKLEVAVIEAALWLLAPVVTAAGFATGIVVAERESRFSSVLAWPLVGCVIGAGAVYWFGPMLIVFGMFVAGTVSVVLREVQVWQGLRNTKIIRELDVVVLTHDIEEYGLKYNDTGTVVHCYENNLAFEVEFMTDEGETIALLTLRPEDIRSMGHKEILHVRELALA